MGSSWEDLGLVFPNTVGRPLDNINLLRYWFYPLVERAGLPRMRFHDLRHTFRTQGAEAGVPLEVMMAQLGHMDRQTSLEYVHIQQHALQRARELIEREQAEVLRAARDRDIEAHPARKTIEEPGWVSIRSSSKVAEISNADQRKAANSRHRLRCRYSSSAQLM